MKTGTWIPYVTDKFVYSESTKTLNLYDNVLMLNVGAQPDIKPPSGIQV